VEAADTRDLRVFGFRFVVNPDEARLVNSTLRWQDVEGYLLKAFDEPRVGVLDVCWWDDARFCDALEPETFSAAFGPKQEFALRSRRES
jgi:hypothetical protein